MESLNRLLIFATYAAVGCVVGIFAWMAGIYYRGASPTTSASGVVAAATGDSETDVVPVARPASGVHVDYLFVQQAQIARLQRLLAEKIALLDKKNRLLEEKTVEQSTLQSELDDALEMLEMLAGAWAESRGNEQDGQLIADLERLREERNKNAALAERLKSDLEELKTQLATTDEEIGQLHDRSEFETTVLLAEMQAFQGIATDALAGLGVDAIPALVNLLRDERPRIRRWAAEVLGEIGPPASEAVPALVDAIGDVEPQVQLAVRAALEQIQPTER